MRSKANLLFLILLFWMQHFAGIIVIFDAVIMYEELLLHASELRTIFCVIGHSYTSYMIINEK